MKYCQGTPVTPGIKRRAWFTSISAIAGWPTIPVDEYDRPISSVYDGAFKLAEGESGIPSITSPAKPTSSPSLKVRSLRAPSR